MKHGLLLSHAFLAAALFTPAHAADIETGKAKAFACMSCHGTEGVSVSPAIPNLAGQKSAYLVKQLNAFRSGTRTDPLMNALAAQLDDKDIENLAAFWSSLPGASTHATAAIPAHIERTRLTFPENYRRDFVHYHTIDFPDRGQVRKYFANKAAVEAARTGSPLPQGSAFLVEVHSVKLDDAKNPVKDGDGMFVPEKLLFYTAMETRPGWGSEFPDLLRNADWNYAVFLADKSVRGGVNQAECLACHKPLDSTSYVFTLEPLQARAKSAR